MYPYRPDYPQCYKDPDVTDAEHLAIAAYHLIEAGYGDAAENLIQKICAAFENIPLDRRLKPPAKQLGMVRYLPCGILKFAGGPQDFNVPAPPFDEGTDDEKETQKQKDVAERGRKSAKRARLGWFSRKQAAAALTGRMPSTGSFRPAVLLGKISALCDAYDPGAPSEIKILLAEKLEAVLQKNALSSDRWTELRQDLTDNGGGRYHHDDDPVMGFAYMSEAQVRIAADIMSRDERNQVGRLQQLEENIIKWRECDRSAVHDLHTMLDHPDSDDRRIPFLEVKYKAYYAKDYYGSQEYYCSVRLGEALRALQDVNDLMRCHAALCRHDDEYLHGLLISTKMVDEDLDGNIAPDLYITAAKIAAGGIWRAFGDDGSTPDRELAASAEKAMAAIIDACRVPDRFDSELLHPPVGPDAGENKDGA